jgi:hypothetical protein
MDSFTDFIMKGIKKSAVAYLAIERSTRPWRRKQHNKLALAPVLVAPPPKPKRVVCASHCRRL